MNNQNQRIDIWHEEAMDFAEMALFAKRRGELYNYFRFIQRALNYEKAAAKLLISDYNKEPTRSILYKGAIHFALNLDHFSEARQLINEALVGELPVEITEELAKLHGEIQQKEKIRSKALAIAQSALDDDEELDEYKIKAAIDASLMFIKATYTDPFVENLLNRVALEVLLEKKNLVSNPDYQIFEDYSIDKRWIEGKKDSLEWSFWKAYKTYLGSKGFASTTIKKLDLLTDDVLARIGDPRIGGKWDKRGMIVGDVQSGKTSNYIGLINKAADLGFRIIIILTGLYESLREQTQQRIDEGFIGSSSNIADSNSNNIMGVGLYRTPKNLPVHPITKSGESGDLRKSSLPNHPIRTNDYYAVVVKKNPAVLRSLLTWLHSQGEEDAKYRVIKNTPVLVIDDEADYASINVDKDFVSKINGSIRAILALFEQSAFIGYTATPFANVFISDFNETEGREITINNRSFRLGEDLFPRDFIINIPPPSNYIGYRKVFDTQLKVSEEYNDGNLPMINIIDDYDEYIPRGHRKQDPLPSTIPPSLKYSIKCFFIVCAARSARGQSKEHNSMLVHVSWYVQWIDKIAYITNQYVNELREKLVAQDPDLLANLEKIWEKEFKRRHDQIVNQLDYEDPQLINHNWEEISFCLVKAAEKIEVRGVHGSSQNLLYSNSQALDYHKYKNGLSVIAVGGNKLSRGLTLEGLSISYFLRATRFYDTLLQMGRWFGYRPGYVDLCRLFTTQELVLWYQYIANATDELKEQFDVMDLAERTPQNFGLKVRTAPGMLMISSTAKIKGATDLSLSFSGDLQETYVLSKSYDVLRANWQTLSTLIINLGQPTGPIRQRQSYIWENVHHRHIDLFIQEYRSNQPSLNPNFLRAYIGQQLRNNNLVNWTVVLINNSSPKNTYTIKTDQGALEVGATYRREVEENDSEGNSFTDPTRYFIRKSHIISPPHEFLDMDSDDPRYLKALKDTEDNRKSRESAIIPAGKYIRKHRGSKNALLLLYVLDPLGFGGDMDQPAVGYALSFPEIQNDQTISYKANQQFIEELFNVPEDAEENPEEDEL
jgi:hypothetical protein